ncbi:uncharacterized protein FOMMEDRAFT_50389, partial [Fomitiporia mediterranea MF3/22]|uniref:uncharacterized protein n=1 Tax=Fomitiporia mediterranea (strain MF3/22) TaxID=694068 RepID=UPI0004407E78
EAALQNPRVSEEAKEHAQQVLDELGDTEEATINTERYSEEKVPDNVARGYKATLKNPRTSESAKEHAREVL